MLPPMLMYMRVGTSEKPGVGIWLPLFLLWLLLLPLLLVALVVTLLVDAVLLLAGQRYHHYTLLLARCLEVVSALHGTLVRVHADGHVIDVDLV